MFNQGARIATRPAVRRIVGVGLVLLVVMSVFVTPVAGAEDPRFEATVPEPELQPGTQQPLTVSITNDAEDIDDQVTTASNVQITARSGSTPFEVISGEQSLGELADGQSGTLTVQVEVPTAVPGGTYHLPLDVTYEYDGDEREQTTVRATVRIPKRPIFEVEPSEVDLHSQETGVMTLEVTNNGSEAATQATLSLASESPALAFDGTQTAAPYLGTIEPGVTTTATVAVTAQGTLAQPATVTVTPRYADTSGQITEAPTRSIGVTPDSEARIQVVETDGSVSPGERGPVEITLENDGAGPMEATVLTLESGATGLSVDSGPSSTRFLGDWAAGETKTVRAAIEAASTMEAETVPLEAQVAFDHPAGIQSQTGPVTVGIPVEATRAFSYDEVTVTHQGPQAILSATVTYDGDTPISNAAVMFESRTSGVQVRDGATAVGTWKPGESVTATATVAMAGQHPAPQQFDAQVRYQAGAEAVRSGSTAVWASLETKGDLFAVEPVNTTLAPDSSNTLRVRIRNEGPVALSAIRARLSPHLPYESQSPTAYVETLEPGGTQVLTFEVTTPEDGVETTDALALNLSAEGPNDRTVMDRPHPVPITVDGGSETAGDSLLIGIGAVVVILVLGGGWWWLNR